MRNGAALIPEENAEIVARRFGASGVRFLAELPQRVADLAARWDPALGDPLPAGIGGYLVGVRMADGTAAVLKVSPTGGRQDKANELEAYALRRWGGEGAVRLFDADPAGGALLIERCHPGVTIDTLPDEELLTAGCELARRLHRVTDAQDERALRSAVAVAADRAARLEEAMQAMGHPLSARAERVIRRSHEQAAAESQVVVCHGDMNPGNLLAAERWTGWPWTRCPFGPQRSTTRHRWCGPSDRGSLPSGTRPRCSNGVSRWRPPRWVRRRRRSVPGRSSGSPASSWTASRGADTTKRRSCASLSCSVEARTGKDLPLRI